MKKRHVAKSIWGQRTKSTYLNQGIAVQNDMLQMRHDDFLHETSRFILVPVICLPFYLVEARMIFLFYLFQFLFISERRSNVVRINPAWFYFRYLVVFISGFVPFSILCYFTSY